VRLVVAVLLVAATLGLVAFRRARRVLRFRYVGAALSDHDYRALAERPGWGARLLDVGDGVTLRGLRRPAQRAGAAWVLFFPGNSSTVLADSQPFLDALVDGTDWGAAVYAYRGFDGSSGTPSPAACSSDALQQYTRLLQDEALERDRVHIVGFSLGTAIAVFVADRAGGQGLASLTLLAPLTEIEVTPPGQRFGGDRYRTLDGLDAIGSPVLVVQGMADELLPPSGAALIADRLGGRARLVQLPGVGHGLLHASGALDAVRTFISTHTPQSAK
jgi:pimeloyl-ACP methyl ester carboxylesterase